MNVGIGKLVETEANGDSRNTYQRDCLMRYVDFKNFDKNLQNLAYLRDAAGF